MAIHLYDVLVLHFIFFLFALPGCNSLPNLDCYPRPEVTRTSHDLSFQYFPYFVQLHRCAGSKGKTSPVIVHCVPSQVEDVFIPVSQPWSRQKLTVRLQNHTQCKTECVLQKEKCKSPAVYDNDKCLCSCDAKAVGPAGLKCQDPRKIWSNEHCACVCKNVTPCKRRRKFNEDTCSCECKNKNKSCDVGRVYDDNICGCRKISRLKNVKLESESSRKGLKFWLSAVLIEFLLMLTVFDAFLYSNNSGIVYNALEYMTKKQIKKQPVDKKAQMTYKEVLRRNSSRNSASIRKRSTRNSSVHPISPISVSSPGYEFSNEEVFAN